MHMKGIRGGMLAVAMAALSFAVPAFSQTVAEKSSDKTNSSDEVSALKQMIMEQNKRIEELQATMTALKQQLDGSGSAVQAKTQPTPQADPNPSLGQVASTTPVIPIAPKNTAVASGVLPGISAAGAGASALPVIASPTDGAENAKAKVEEKLSDLAYGKVKIGGLFYGDWAYYTNTGFGPQFLTQLNQDGPGNNGFNSFDVTRTYLNIFYTPTEAVTLRITPNIYRQVDGSSAMANGKGSGIASSSNGNLGFRLKYAYVDFNTVFKNSEAFKKDKITVGQTTNPLVDWEEGLYNYRFVNLTPWNYLSLSSTYTGAVIKGPIEFNGKEYLDYHLGVFNTASFHAIETNDKKQVMGRLTWYPMGTTSDRTGFGLTAFEDYGYNTKTPDAISTPLNRLALLAHYQTHSKNYLIAAEYDLGHNAFSTGNMFSGAGPGDLIGLGPTPYATFSSLASALLGGVHTKQQGFDVFGHARLGHSPVSVFGMYEYFQPNANLTVTNPLDFQRNIIGLSVDVNKHFTLAFDDQLLDYFHKQFTMTQDQIATFSTSLAAANPNGIADAVPKNTNVVFVNLQFSY
jgi:hypothetical protein